MESEPQKEGPEKAENIIIKNLRTFEDDVKNIVKRKSISKSDILVSEQKKKQKQLVAQHKQAIKNQKAIPSKPSNRKGLSMILGSIILLGIGAVAIYYSLDYVAPLFKKDTNTTITTSLDSLSTDKTITISTVNKTAREIIANIRAKLREGSLAEDNDLIEFSIVKRVLTTVNGGEISTTLKITNSDFFRLIESDVDEALIRSFRPEILIGAHQREGALEPFVVMRVNSFEDSFAGMLDWEEEMVSEIKDIFFENLGSSQVFVGEGLPTPTEPTPAPTTEPLATSTPETASSTEEVAFVETIKEDKPTYDPQNFEDLILLNKDVRAIKDSNGKILFFYNFSNRENLIMTTNIETFDIILKRLNISKLIR